VPGAFIIGRNVLEWRLDPRSEARIPALARADAQIIVMCAEGYSSTLAAATLRRIGRREATDLAGPPRPSRLAGACRMVAGRPSPNHRPALATECDSGSWPGAARIADSARVTFPPCE
jgi:hypothetical protein